MPADALSDDDISLFALRQQATLLAVGAIRHFEGWGEIKSMHTAQAARGRGAAKALLSHLIAEAQAAGLSRLNLETGSGPEHLAARRLYASAGFEDCPPFGSYKADPLSHFMTREL